MSVLPLGKAPVSSTTYLGFWARIRLSDATRRLDADRRNSSASPLFAPFDSSICKPWPCNHAFYRLHRVPKKEPRALQWALVETRASPDLQSPTLVEDHRYSHSSSFAIIIRSRRIRCADCRSRELHRHTCLHRACRDFALTIHAC